MDTQNNSTPAASNSAPSGDLYAALAYLPFLFILTMIKKGDSPSHVWHAKNGAGFLVLAIGVNIVEQILARTIGLYFLVPLLSVALLLLMLFAAWQAWNGKQLNIPVVTPFGQKIPLEKWFHKGMVEGSTGTVSATPAFMPEAPAPVEATPMPAPEAAPAPVAVMPEPMPMTPTPVEAVPAPMAVMPEPMPMTPAPVEAAPMSATPASEPSVPPSAPEAPTQTPSA